MDFMPEYLNIPADPNIDAFICQMNNIKKSLYGKVDKNIQEGQEKQKNEYDKKQKQSKVSLLKNYLVFTYQFICFALEF